MSIGSALREHWPEYLIEGWALGSFMISVGLFVTIFEFAEVIGSRCRPRCRSTRRAFGHRHRYDSYLVDSLGLGESGRALT